MKRHVLGDVDGSVDAIMGTLEKYHSKHCHLDVIHTGVGNVTQTDVNMAEAFKGGCVYVLGYVLSLFLADASCAIDCWCIMFCSSLLL